MNVNVYYHPAALEHKGFPGFAERPARLRTLAPLFNELGLPVIEPPPATEILLHLAHRPAYVEHVKTISEKGLIGATIANIASSYVQWYTRVSPGSYKAATYAVGAVIQAVEDTLSGKCNRAFCAVRPPGHHAGPEKGEGFCLFNNIAIGAIHALRSGAARVAIIDFDRHHGNGTQDIVEQQNNENILFISSYQEGCKYDHNEREGCISRNVLTVPISENSDFSVVKKLYEKEVIPALYEFKPDLILISAGFDMHKSDPLTNLKLEAEDYSTLTDMIVTAANDLCQGRVVSALEGGYELRALESCVRNHLQALQRHI
jgi:acetoin utilization deacetylase AcuC-like enzyme